MPLALILSQRGINDTCYVCVCLYVFIPFILDVRLLDAPAGVTQEEGHIGFLHLPSGVFALIFLARRIQSSLSQVTVESNFVYPRINRSPGMFFVFFCFLFYFL